VGAARQVVVGQGMMIARGESQAGREVTGIRGESEGWGRLGRRRCRDPARGQQRCDPRGPSHQKWGEDGGGGHW
jgi:hypothetical protein